MASVGIGIIGCGDIATQRHIPSWKKIRQAKVLAVADVNEDKARAVAEAFHIPRYYTDYREMIEMERNLEVLDVCTPTKYHSEHAIYACRSGKHVVVEKPMARTPEECQEMIETSRENKVKLTICHTMRCYPAVRKTRELIDRGDIGEGLVFHAITPYLEVQPWVLSQGGVLWELGIHRVYLVLYLMGNIEKVEARTYSNKDPQENMEVILHTSKGIGIIHLFRGGGEESISICGSKKRIVFPPLTFNIALVEEGRHESWFDLYKCEALTALKTLGGVTSRVLGYQLRGVAITPHYGIFNQFINAINGKGDIPVPGEEGKETVRILKEIEAQIY